MQRKYSIPFAVLHLLVMAILIAAPSAGRAEFVTGKDFPLIGDPEAQKGGVLRYAISEYPATFRVYGPNANTTFISMMESLVYQRLVGIHPETLKFIPMLAEAWEIGEDRRTFRFRLDPDARWADGRPVTPEDVLFSWDLATNPGIKDPYTTELYGKFERPVIEDSRTVKITAKTLHWRNFMFIGANLAILPAHTYRGKDYLETFQWQMPNGSGPYDLGEFQKGRTIEFQRRKDFWARDKRAFLGTHNFDTIRFIVIRDSNLELEKFKKGDLDFYGVRVARRWKEDLTPEKIDSMRMGWMQKRKIYTRSPNGIYGQAFNTRRKPFDDVRVRKALALLYDRAKLLDKLFYNEYLPMDSYFPGTVYENPDNEKITYNPEEARELLARAGWGDRNPQGIRVKDGRPFSFTLIYGSQESERHLTVYQQDLRRAGIEMNLKLTNFATMWKLIDDRNFDMASVGWSALIFPNPEFNFHSRYADQNQTNNITGFKNQRVDQILEAYPGMFDLDERISALREMDGLIHKEHPYVLNWYAPFSRVLYWNRFGIPPFYLSKTGDLDDILSLWWFDPEKDRALKTAMKENKTLPVGPVEIDYWREH